MDRVLGDEKKKSDNPSSYLESSLPYLRLQLWSLKQENPLLFHLKISLHFITSAIFPSRETRPAHLLSNANRLLCCIPSFAPSFPYLFAFQSVPSSCNSVFSHKYVEASLIFKIFLVHLSLPSCYSFSSSFHIKSTTSLTIFSLCIHSD